MSKPAGVSAALISGVADSLTLKAPMSRSLSERAAMRSRFQADSEPERLAKVTFLPQFADNSLAAGVQSLDMTACFV
jgi:hypothetical protein